MVAFSAPAVNRVCSGRWLLTCRNLLFPQRRQRLGQSGVALAAVDLVEHYGDRFGELIRVERLRQIAVRAELERAHPIGELPSRRDEDDRYLVGRPVG